jgi:TonB family protein
MTAYLFSSCLILGMFYLVYISAFSRDTFLMRNRIYLLSGLFLALLLPILPLSMELPGLNGIYTSRAEAGLPVLISGPSVLSSPATNEAGTRTLSPAFFLKLLYFSGIVLLFLRLVFQLLKIIRLIIVSSCERNGIYRIIYHSSNWPHFSFFHFIFLNASFFPETPKEKAGILAHEMAHFRQGHSFDLLLMETITILQWFNPFVWLYRSALREVHEYLADRQAIAAGGTPAEYQAILVNQTLGIPVFQIVHPFNCVNLKKRITMMTCKKTSEMAHLKALVLIPLVALAISLSAWAQEQQKNITVRGKVYDKNTEQPLAGAHIIIKGTTVGTVADQQGRYSVNAQKGSTLVVSYVGYATAFVEINISTTVDIGLETEFIDLEHQKISDANEVNTPPVKTEGGTFYAVEEMPAFPGGLEGFRNYINQHLVYPAPAKDRKAQGDVLVSFVVNEKGFTEQVKVIQLADPELDAEAVRVISESPQWKPGTNDGKPVKVGFTIPVKFSLAEDDSTFLVVEEMPKFNGGNPDNFRQYIAENLRYPEEAKKQNITGKVFVSFVVGSDGNVRDVKIVRGVHPLLDEECLRVVSSSPQWTPGKQKGKNVAVQFTFPVIFQQK